MKIKQERVVFERFLRKGGYGEDQIYGANGFSMKDEDFLTYEYKNDLIICAYPKKPLFARFDLNDIKEIKAMARCKNFKNKYDFERNEEFFEKIKIATVKENNFLGEITFEQNPTFFDFTVSYLPGTDFYAPASTITLNEQVIPMLNSLESTRDKFLDFNQKLEEYNFKTQLEKNKVFEEINNQNS